jgi:hypothetical protein
MPNPVTYLPLLPYEKSYTTIANTPDGLHANQDALMIAGIDRRNNNTSVLRASSSMEGAAYSRYGLALKNYLDLLTSFPGNLK